MDDVAPADRDRGRGGDRDRDLDRDVAGAADAHQRLLATLDAWIDAGDPSPSAASRLPDWTVGHVLTHIARHAESVERMLAGHDQYPGGMAAREADIAAGAGRPAHELVADVRRTIWSLEAAWSAPRDWDATARRVSGTAPMRELPFLRWRETEVHHVDLGLGVTFADLPADYVRLELRRMEMLWRARKPMGMTPLPEAALARPPHERLAWLMGRASIPDLPAAGIL